VLNENCGLAQRYASGDNAATARPEAVKAIVHALTAAPLFYPLLCPAHQRLCPSPPGARRDAEAEAGAGAREAQGSRATNRAAPGPGVLEASDQCISMFRGPSAGHCRVQSVQRYPQPNRQILLERPMPDQPDLLQTSY